MSRYSDLVIALAPGLYWTLDGATGATDQSGNARDGTGVGGITIGGFADSPIYAETTSTDMDGTDDWITSTYNPYTNSTVRTFCGWANRDLISGQDDIFVSLGADWNALLVEASNRWVSFYSAAGAGNLGYNTAWPGELQWVFWTLVADDVTDVASLYLNGSLFETKAWTAGWGASPGNFRLGGSGANTFNGKQAHVAIFEKGLTADQIRLLYQTGRFEMEQFTGPRSSPTLTGPGRATNRAIKTDGP